MPAFDYLGWVARARAFTARVGNQPHGEVRSAVVALPATQSEVDAVERTLGRPIPPTFQAFLTQGASGLDCAYTLERGEAVSTVFPNETRMFGGARISALSELLDNQTSVSEWARDTWVADDSAQRLIWESALPISRLDNGDYLALDLGADANDPSVVYLNHDDESFTLAPGFLNFLDIWERLCYIGPEHWLLGEFIGEHGYLDPDSDRASQLRGLFMNTEQ